MFDISKSLFQIGNKNTNGSEAALTKDAVAELLGTTPEALAAFEASYQANVLDAEVDTGSLFDISAKQAAAVLPQEDLNETAKKPLNGSLRMRKKSMPCAIPFTVVWPRFPTG